MSESTDCLTCLNDHVPLSITLPRHIILDADRRTTLTSATGAVLHFVKVTGNLLFGVRLHCLNSNSCLYRLV